MDIFEGVSWIAVLACGVSTVVLGALWYSPLMFVKVWARKSGVSMEGSFNMPRAIGITFVIGLLAGLVFAFFVGPDRGVLQGMLCGLVTGLFWVGGFTAINKLWSRKSVTVTLIDAGYQTVQFVIYGLIMGLLQ